ncbi:hypothetical protein IEU95_01730 [Hoyosella rhizosphaerae]|uniref:Uncharacterized protein n=1 Tax=Hoyosella rhizosphaerae TaxID=1755582 RepID=A0A916XFK3_9ACTN|nr:hypothetical protein [Hoyosella rhizosphaerae]MBN4925535.1 hypothetical protein [Hoyosella rhizosphaerae]GGC69880.1 hypothetical protein GCM10011410_23400 [Hoyosella rhizosphaerae]
MDVREDPLADLLGIEAELPALTDAVWDNALRVATDPNTPALGDHLVPEMDDDGDFSSGADLIDNSDEISFSATSDIGEQWDASHERDFFDTLSDEGTGWSTGDSQL